MNSCKTCKWWKSHPIKMVGDYICDYPISQMPRGNFLFPFPDGLVFTGQDFLCSLFEPKNEEPKIVHHD